MYPQYMYTAWYMYMIALCVQRGICIRETEEINKGERTAAIVKQN